jgi:hypothetical protein
MASTTENVKLGVCSVLFDGVNMGYTKGGVEVEVATSSHEVKVDQYGETPIGEIITGRTVSAKVPLAETTLENLVAIMPGSQLITDGVKASGSVTLSTAAPVNGDRVTIAGTTFTFRTRLAEQGDVKIGTGAKDAGIAASAANLAAAINGSDLGYIATSASGVVTITARATGAGWGADVVANFATAANVAKTAIGGGVDATSARVVVSTGVNLNLLSVARTLVLRPRGTFGEDDFTIHRAACAGALSFSYSLENERVYKADFKGYAMSNSKLFSVGNGE